MDFQQVREVFNKGSVILTDGKLSVFYSRNEAGWGDQSFSDTDPDGKPDISKRVLAQLIQNSERFEMHFFGNGSFRLDFLMPSEIREGNVKYCWFMPLTRDKTAGEFKQEFLEWARSNPPEWVEFRDFMADYNLDDPEEARAAVETWSEFTTEFDDTPVSEEQQHRWDAVLSAARAFYATTAIGTLEIDEPEPGQNYGYAEFQTETRDHLVFALTDQKKELFLKLVQAADVVSFEAGNNDGGLLTCINITFYS